MVDRVKWWNVLSAETQQKDNQREYAAREKGPTALGNVDDSPGSESAVGTEGRHKKWGWKQGLY